MDVYWDKIVENMLGDNSITSNIPSVLSRESQSPSFTSPGQPPVSVSPTSTSNYSNSKKEKKSKDRRKVKFQDDLAKQTPSIKGVRNVSLTSDEGIDMAYTSQSTAINFSSIPRGIRKPQHPLKSSWTFWFSAGNKHLSWEQNQVEISTVSTIEQFWLVINQLRSPSNIPKGYTYSVFRAGVLPDWEDQGNIKGGRWMVTCSEVEKEDKFDSWWLDLLYMIIGEHIDEFAGLVNGVEACVRKKGDRVEVWVKEDDMKGVVEVGRAIKTKLAIHASGMIKFSLHKEDKKGVKGPRLAI